MIQDELIMEKCIKLAKKGTGYVSPNPLVGCVIVKNKEIIGVGYHEQYGGNHAEVNAIELAKRKGYKLNGAVLYTNLEPCSHTGKTPPCTDLIIKEKIKKVIIGMKDPNPEVNGKGIEMLKEAGIQVEIGILKEECKKLNKFFIKYITEKQPYVMLKIAQSIDGKIASKNKESKWITGDKSRRKVHKLRSIFDAVLVGYNTARLDDPALTVRDVKGRSPKRIVVDTSLKLPANLKLFNDEQADNTFVVTSADNKKDSPDSKKFIFCKSEEDKIDVRDFLKKAYDMKIQSILVEGGADLFSSFVKEKLADEILIFIAPKIIGKGLSSFENFEIKDLNEDPFLEFDAFKKINGDILLRYKKKALKYV